ncbi:potassium channel family protein [Thermococcus sp. JCM 11816]|uniref:potassium channel family protein n=1 Tax=Thermococcus sp. (strain JCM 11816 / KS-1) TaxID=1295125 RepID=UPI0034664E2B
MVSHPARRKIIRLLIFLGSAGITSAIATLVLTFVGKSRGGEALNSLVILVFSLVFLYVFFTSKRVERWMRRVIKRFLEKRFPELKVYDYNQLLGLSRGGYSISRIQVKRNSWLANKTLRELELDKEGVLVLGIFRKTPPRARSTWGGPPRGDTQILPGGDILICYGPEEALLNLSKRVRGGIKGDKEHEEAVKKAELKRMEEEMLSGS